MLETKLNSAQATISLAKLSPLCCGWSVAVVVAAVACLSCFACVSQAVFTAQHRGDAKTEAQQRRRRELGGRACCLRCPQSVLRGFGKATSAVGCVVWEQVEIIRIPLSALSVDANLKHWHQKKKKAEDCWNWTGQETEPSQRQVWTLKLIFSFFFFCKIVVYLMGEQINDPSLRRILLSFVPSPS